MERRISHNAIIQNHYTEIGKIKNAETEREEQLINHFVVSVQKAKTAGYDGVQVNLPTIETDIFVNNYAQGISDVEELSAQFKLAAKIIEAIKETCGTAFPVTLNVKLSHSLINYFESQLTEELFYEPILTYDDFIESFRTLEKAGYDGFNLAHETENSNWYLDSIIQTDFKRLSQTIKKWVNVPVIISVFKCNTEQAGITINSGAADAVEMEDSVRIETIKTEQKLINNVDYFVPSYFWRA